MDTISVQCSLITIKQLFAVDSRKLLRFPLVSFNIVNIAPEYQKAVALMFLSNHNITTNNKESKIATTSVNMDIQGRIFWYNNDCVFHLFHARRY